MKTLTTLFLTTFLALTVGCSLTGPARADDSYFSQAELDSMLAPVALYPDSVLSHVLIAATYPLEVIQAARWSREHPGLRGEDAVSAVEYQKWDPSVKALVAFPDLLRRMDEDLDWTQDLGDAFLVQEEDVIASIQYLRSEAYSQGHLRSNERVKVVREKEYIYIEPARTRLVYVPYYDPRVVYSNWRWSSYPPRYWHRPSGYNVGISFYWGRPYTIRPNFYFSSFHWAQRRVVVVNHHHHYYRDRGFRSGRDVARFRDARHWRHDPVHRRGVSYRGRVEKTRFVDNSRPASAATRSVSASQRTAVRSDRRQWAAERRSSVKFDRNAQTRSRVGSSSAASRSDRVAELRGSDRANQRSRVEGRDRGSSRTPAQRTQRASVGEQRERSRSVTGSAPERASSRARSSDSASARSSGNRAGRVSDSLRGSASSSRESASGRSRGVERSSSRSSSSKSGARSNRSERSRSSVEVPRGLSPRSSSNRERSYMPSRSSRTSASSSSRGATTSRAYAPGRQSAPSRSRSSGRDSAPSRSTPRVHSAPSRSSKSSSPSRSRASTPSRSARSSSPSRSSGASSRSSRSSAPSRSRGGDSRRGGRDERR